MKIYIEIIKIKIILFILNKNHYFKNFLHNTHHGFANLTVYHTIIPLHHIIIPFF